jgi:hypothetical protein
MLVSELVAKSASKPASMPLKIASAMYATCLLAALAVPFAAPKAAAASPDRARHTVAGKQHRAYRARVAAYRDPRFRRGVRPGGEYRYIPPNAIRMPGYIFVPGVGILGESCDLPTSACPNEYRDIQ